MIKKIILWIILICCMGLIFYFSSQEATASDKTSSGFVEIIIKFFDFNDRISDVQIAKINENFSTLVRKTAHFSIYLILSFIASLLLCEYKITGLRQVLFAVIFSFLYACSDEFHQLFVEGRSAQISDIALDTCGAILGAFLVLLIKRRKRNALHKNL